MYLSKTWPTFSKSGALNLLSQLPLHFSESTAGYVEWMICIGKGAHTHVRTVKNADKKLVKDHLRDL